MIKDNQIDGVTNSEDHQVRKKPRLVSSPDWESKVDTARSMNLLDVAQRLGIELKKEASSKVFEAL